MTPDQMRGLATRLRQPANRLAEDDADPGAWLKARQAEVAR
jgi:hypothetical protein